MMQAILLNCDLGERGVAHPVDDQLVSQVQLINLACGGHTGDEDSVRYYLDLAAQYGTQVSAHFSYPDIEHFGRRELNLSWGELEASLVEQLSLFEETPRWCKPHGALYHRVHQDSALASEFLSWLKIQGFQGVIGMPDSLWLELAVCEGLETLSEGFAERRYVLNEGRLKLSSRQYSWASISDLTEAIDQGRSLMTSRQVEVYIQYSEEGSIESSMMNLNIETLCIHSDAPIALGLTEALAKLNHL